MSEEIIDKNPTKDSILSSLRLIDQYFSSRRHSYTSKDLYMAEFRSSVRRREIQQHFISQGLRTHERLSFEGDAAMITEKTFLKGRIGNLSSTGAYIKTDDAPFKVDQDVRLKIKPEGEEQTLKSTARVVRIDKLADGSTGFALCFHAV